MTRHIRDQESEKPAKQTVEIWRLSLGSLNARESTKDASLRGPYRTRSPRIVLTQTSKKQERGKLAFPKSWL
jgi:hypothetical protein